MRTKQYKITGAELLAITDHLVEDKNLPYTYKNFSDHMAVLINEEYYLRTNTTQLNMVVAKKEGEDLLLDIIAGGAGTGLLRITWGSENDYIYWVEEALKRYVKAHNLKLEVLKELH